MSDLLTNVGTEGDSRQTLYCNSTQNISTLVEPQQQITDRNHFFLVEYVSFVFLSRALIWINPIAVLYLMLSRPNSVGNNLLNLGKLNLPITARGNETTLNVKTSRQYKLDYSEYVIVQFNPKDWRKQFKLLHCNHGASILDKLQLDIYYAASYACPKSITWIFNA